MGMKTKTVIDSGSGRRVSRYLRRGWTVASSHRRLLAGGIVYILVRSW